MTQLGRYIEHMKFEIEGIRMVQYSPYAITQEMSASRASQSLSTHICF